MPYCFLVLCSQRLLKIWKLVSGFITGLIWERRLTVEASLLRPIFFLNFRVKYYPCYLESLNDLVEASWRDSVQKGREKRLHPWDWNLYLSVWVRWYLISLVSSGLRDDNLFLPPLTLLWSSSSKIGNSFTIFFLSLGF